VNALTGTVHVTLYNPYLGQLHLLLNKINTLYIIFNRVQSAYHSISGSSYNTVYIQQIILYIVVHVVETYLIFRVQS